VITLVLGGVRSGKSAIAEQLALRSTGPVLYFATGTATDGDMAARIELHQARRDERFDTNDAGADLIGALAGHDDQPALIDSLGTWVAGHESLTVDTNAITAALCARRAPTVIVSEEVGLGVHPSSEVGRQFRDALGELNHAVAAIADDVLLVIAGRVLPLSAPKDL
jgi:adenosyl cobinamide kinase/adenosyl cobinamide phosphate guanylyltransferase